ncbi:MAG: DUF4344 domain-containing metallopeptidase [Pseudomonadota bacterium]
MIQTFQRFRRVRKTAYAATLIFGLSAVPTGAEADLDLGREAFVSSNVLGAFYHELGHAVIDLLNIPVFGKEEDAADVFSVILIDSLFEDEAAESMALDVALPFLAEAENVANGGDPTAWWSAHGPDEQRFYNTVCLFYGADPSRRGDFAEDMELPEDRAQGCADEFQLALDSWGPVLDELETLKGNRSFVANIAEDARQLAPIMSQVMIEEMDALNEIFGFAKELSVSVELCGEANAFYDLDGQNIIMCAEYEPHFAELYAQTL